ncbi:MAG: group III truncated hemoglobin [Brachymonas sp.]|nr:group III truncated hemoglobin [Brachymonas sp.]
MPDLPAHNPIGHDLSKAPTPVVTSPMPERAQIHHFVVRFYEEIRKDELLGPVFARIIPDERWPQHFEIMTDFWSAVAFGGASFRGNPMVKHALIKDIAVEHFARWLQVFDPVARACWPEDIAHLLIFRAHQLAPAIWRGVHRAREKGLVDINALH